MPGLHLFRSNRIEILARLLAAVVVDKAPADPFCPIEVVVGSRGMERWLRHQLAQQLLVCANFSFPFPASRIDSLVASVLGSSDEPSALDPWQPEALSWALLEVLPGLVSRPEFEVVAGYLDRSEHWHGAIEAKQLGLARQLAALFDRYIAYRPELACAWSAVDKAQSEADPWNWQRTLWRGAATQLKGQLHRAQRMALAERRLRESVSLPALGAPLLIFGVSSLPPSWMSLLGALSRHLDVELFLLCPSDRYWAELHRVGDDPACVLPEDRNELSEALRVQGAEASHPLLVSMGRVARDFQLILESQADQYVDQRIEAFPDPASGSAPRALHYLQSDLLAARHPSEAPDHATRMLHADDDSVRFHCCYGSTRQVEVLRDLLLGMLADHPDLEPRNILVMTPDIEKYAPLVTAVFSQGLDHRRNVDSRADTSAEGWGPTGAPRIPFEIADLSVRRLNPIADALLRVLELADSRLQASALVDLLTLEPVRLRFEIEPDDLPLVQNWIQQSSIRWAKDAEHRARSGQPSDPQNTWVFGLRRLALGVVMADNDQLVQGEDSPGVQTEVRPFDDLEGAQTLLVGKLIDFCNTLFDIVAGLRGARTVEQWKATLNDLLDRMTSAPASGTWLAIRVRETLAELAAAAKSGANSRLVTLDAIRNALSGRLDVASRITREHCGAVTFCAMRPMRSVPYEVICMLGMDEDSFPRSTGGFAFDLVAQHPRVGDMDPRDEDRYLMLEAILAARRNLVVLYSGRDPRTNKHTPPCVPVAELRDLVDQSFPTPAKGRSPAQWMTTEHPLQSFSPRAFMPEPRSPQETGRPWSFDRRLRAAAEARRDKRVTPSPFLVVDRNRPPRSETQRVTLTELIQFFKNPAKHLVWRRLKIHLEDSAESIPDREPIELDHLQRWSLRRALLDRRIRGLPVEHVLRAMRAEGTLPLGYAGKITVKEQADLVERMLEQAHLLPTTDGMQRSVEPVAIDVSLGGWRVTGSCNSIVGSLLIDLQFGDEDAGRLVSGWLTLLSLHAAHPGIATRGVVVLGNTSVGRPVTTLLGFEPPPDPKETLLSLVRLYDRGIVEPIALFPRASWEFAKAMDKVASDGHWLDRGLPQDPASLEVVAKAFEAARKAWMGGFQGGDAQDPYIERLFEGTHPIVDESVTPVPIDLEFARLALTVWGPVRQGRRTSTHAKAWLQDGAS